MKIKPQYHPNPMCASFHCDTIISETIFESYSAPYKEIWEVKQVVGGIEGGIIREPVRTEAPKFVKDLFEIDGVTEVNLRRYEIGIHKAEVFEWQDMEPKIIEVIRNNFDIDRAVNELMNSAGKDSQ